MDAAAGRLKEKLERFSREWMQKGLPSRQELERVADELTIWKNKLNINGLWDIRPLMITATLDDGLGQGLQIIQRYAQVLGLDVTPLGLLQKPENIIAACHRYNPAFLGLTILQLDTEADLCRVGHNIPSSTLLIAGGPVFKFDPEMAQRCNVSYVAGNVAYFVDYLLSRFRWFS